MDINWLAVVLAAVSAFILGGIWYGPLFGKLWMEHSGMTEEKAKSANMGMTYGLAFVFSLIAAIVFALVVGRDTGWQAGATTGFLVGLGMVAASFAVSYLFEQRSRALWLVNGGYHTAQFTLYGLIIGLMA